MSLASGLDFIELLSVNFILELKSFCSSAIVRQADGTVLHARNLDYYNPETLRNNSVYIA
jgi:hypothetical protein